MSMTMATDTGTLTSIFTSMTDVRVMRILTGRLLSRLRETNLMDEVEGYAKRCHTMAEERPGRGGARAKQ